MCSRSCGTKVGNWLYTSLKLSTKLLLVSWIWFQFLRTCFGSPSKASYLTCFKLSVTDLTRSASTFFSVWTGCWSLIVASEMLFSLLLISCFKVFASLSTLFWSFFKSWLTFVVSTSESVLVSVVVWLVLSSWELSCEFIVSTFARLSFVFSITVISFLFSEVWFSVVWTCGSLSAWTVVVVAAINANPTATEVNPTLSLRKAYRYWECFCILILGLQFSII